MTVPGLEKSVDKNGYVPLQQFIKKNTKASHDIATKYATTQIQD